MPHTKHEIAAALNQNSQQFIDVINQLSSSDFEHTPQGRWSAGQHLAHLVKSIRPLNTALALPAFVPRLLFGKAKSPSRTYEAIKQFYQSKLNEGAKATGAYIPAQVSYSSKVKLTNTLLSEAAKLAATLDDMTEEQIDAMLLPHPILGKLTLREMLFFTIYHTAHHTKSVAGK